MKKPYLANYVNKIKINNNINIYYDQLSQINYIDHNKNKKMINIGNVESTIETRVVENSDPDEYNLFGSTTTTFTVEDSDSDEVYELGSTKITESIEDSDADELYRMSSTVATANVENSDPDEFYLC